MLNRGPQTSGGTIGNSALEERVDKIKLGWGLALIGFLAGLLLSWGILSGDQLGRVNLLYLLLLFVIWPMVALLLTALALVSGSKNNLARLLCRLSIWPRRWQASLKKLNHRGLAQPWLFCQSQSLALSFSLGNLLAFALLLLGSDINFVWRSTLLDARQLLPWLETLAAPWQFWSSAQPSLALVEWTRDSRLLDNHRHVLHYGQWWQYLLAAQCCYAILPRCCLWLVGQGLYQHRRRQQQRSGAGEPSPLINQLPATPELAGMITVDHHLGNGELGPGFLSDHAVINWCGLPAELQRRLDARLGPVAQQLMAGPQASPAQEQQAFDWPGPKIILVAAWEPPLGELKDFLAAGKGYLLPLDWEGQQWRTPSATHLDEWRRFCFELEHWQLLQLTELR